VVWKKAGLPGDGESENIYTLRDGL
jgi:hypothetical protein